MAQLTLFINISNNTLVAGLASTQPVDPLSLPFFYGDTLNLKIYLLQTPPGYNAQDPSNSQLQVVPIAGLTLYLYLDNGVIVGQTIYADQVAFTPDYVNNCWTGQLALNTAQLQTLLGASTSQQCWLKVGYVQNGLQTTVLSRQINVGVGLPVGALAIIPGLTPLSLEVARTLFFPINPVAGMPLYLESQAGKIIGLEAVDQPDGSADFEANAVN